MNLNDALRASMPTVVATAAVWISFQQYRIAEAKLKLDLYDRRMAVYEGFRELLEVVTLDSIVAVNLAKFRACIGHAEFLFGVDVIKFLRTVEEKYKRLLKLSGKMRSIKAGTSQESLQDVERQFDEQLDEFLEMDQTGFAVFQRYLSMHS
ncbi:MULTISPECIES: hypothetical protein [Xanthomonas]|uniref:hypothetical protein n=1 Tax=Xanthomonas TaxID=338 RepID=UPI00136B0366|nr:MULTISPECIES: hypothetical protein [Xanthomonas]MBB4768630.1 hypothetical protein [Xanthomonas arboricola]